MQCAEGVPPPSSTLGFYESFQRARWSGVSEAFGVEFLHLHTAISGIPILNLLFLAPLPSFCLISQGFSPPGPVSPVCLPQLGVPSLPSVPYHICLCTHTRASSNTPSLCPVLPKNIPWLAPGPGFVDCHTLFASIFPSSSELGLAFSLPPWAPAIQLRLFLATPASSLLCPGVPLPV